jgi:hypothetical protein
MRGEIAMHGLSDVPMYWSYQDPVRLEVDNFDKGDDPTTNSLGGAVIFSRGFTIKDEFELQTDWYGPVPDLYMWPGKPDDPARSPFYQLTHGLVLVWGTLQTYESRVPSAYRDVSAYDVLSVRVARIPDPNLKNDPVTVRAGLRTASGMVGRAAPREAPPPYLRYFHEPHNLENYWPTAVLTTIRIPLRSFKLGWGLPMPLHDITGVVLELEGAGMLAIDDIQFSR